MRSGRTAKLIDFDADVAVIGAGPAGSAVALALAGSCRVVVLDRSTTEADRIGETLPHAARPLLDRLGLWPRFEREQLSGYRARRQVWGGPERVDLQCRGWRLDRPALEAQLKSEIASRGIEILAAVGVTAIARDSDGWSLDLVGRGYARPIKLCAKLIVDASGRASRTLRPFGQTRLAEDRLVCGWVHAPLRGDPSEHLYVESEPEGWWYSAALPDGRRLIAFYTDSDLPVTSQLLQNGLVERAGLSSALSAAIDDCELGQVTPVRFCAAHGARLDRVTGEGWIAAGDAALCLDPLASHGLLNAFDTGLKAAGAALRLLGGEEEAAEDYDGEIVRLWRAGRKERATRYAQETRWPDSPFWRRRANGA